jgi:RNA-directed DNA polymerase
MFGNIVGGELSPVLSNLLVDDLAQELARRGPRFARYCADFLIVGKSQRAGDRVKASRPRFLPQPLKLEINETKRTGGPTKEGGFRGLTFHGTRL